MKLSYIGKYSACIKRDLMKTLKKSFGQIPFRYTFNIVYKISCTCGHSYIGHTCRSVLDRVREHKDVLTKPYRFSYVAEHIKDSGHNIDWFNVKIITRDNITIKRLIKETLAISSLKPEMNAKQSSVQLNVFN